MAADSSGSSSSSSSGSSRTERILGAAFAEGLDSLDLPALRARRREAEAEEQELSYTRRMLQGRVDVLRAELRRRAGHGDPLLPSLSRILADAPTNARGSRHVPVVPPHRSARQDQATGSDVWDIGPDLHKLTDRELRGAIDSMEARERSVSDTRARIHRVLGRLSAELTRRYREGTAQVDDLLASVRRR